MKVLLIIDYQNEWIDKSSKVYVGDLSEKISRLNKLIQFCRGKKVPIIFTHHVSRGSKTSFAEGTEGVEIIKSVDYRRGEDALIEKNKVSPFYNTDLEAELRKLKADELVITGILTNLCVRSAISDAYDRDYTVTVITDTCVAVSKELEDFTFKDLKNTRSTINFSTVNKFIQEH